MLGLSVSLARATTTALAVMILFAGACSSDSSSDGPGAASNDASIFGTEDTTCTSVSTRNEDGDDTLIREVATCLLDAVAAERAVTVDVAVLSAEGDPIYYRYAYDGEQILIVEDNRADEFGRPNVVARTCEDLSRTRWLPEGRDCVDADHAGFPEAVR